MVLFVILGLILIGAILIGGLFVSIFGGGAVLLLSDAIVCIALIVFIMRKIVNKK